MNDIFEAHRELLEGLAYRMCGVWADTEDIVQETHIRWCRANHDRIENPRAWLVTVCTRLALDKLRRVRREAYIGPWLPEPLPGTPGHQAALDDSISMALMVALERLSPVERATFLLHDVFGYDFAGIATILKRSEAACRKAASRARRAVREARPRFSATAEEHRLLLGAFLEAVRGGDSSKLTALLAESVELHADGGGRVPTAPDVLRGREAVATFFLKVWQPDARVVEQWFNGQPGVLIYQGETLRAALCITPGPAGIERIYAVRNPEKLGRFSPSPLQHEWQTTYHSISTTDLHQGRI